MEKKLKTIRKISKKVTNVSNLEYREFFNCFAALVLIRKAEVSLIYEEFNNCEFMQANNKFFKDFIEYFERNWISTLLARKRGTHEIKIIWNQFQYIQDPAIKTTIYLKSWHASFNLLVSKTHPSFDKLFTVL